MAPVCEDGGFFFWGNNLCNLERMCIFVLEEINSKILSHEKNSHISVVDIIRKYVNVFPNFVV